jgi:hypothetical protein
MKSYFFSVNLNLQTVSLYKTIAVDSNLQSPFQTTEGWIVMISLAIASLGIYLLAFILYTLYERYKSNKVLQESLSLGKKIRIL